MRMRTGFDTGDTASLLVIEQSHSSFDCLRWREIDLRSFDLDPAVNLLAVISVHWNEKV